MSKHSLLHYNDELYSAVVFVSAWCVDVQRFASWVILQRLALSFPDYGSIVVSWGIAYTGSSYLRLPTEWLFALKGCVRGLFVAVGPTTGQRLLGRVGDPGQ